MSERGVFAIDRGAWEHDFLADDQPFSRREAWFWLVSEAAWKPHRRRILGRQIELMRGQYCGSFRFIASKWRWSEARVRRFVSGLISELMVVAKIDAGVTVITICNYDRYQRVSLPDDAMREIDVDAGATQERRKVEDKEDMEDKETPSLRSGVALPAAKPKRARARAALPDDWALDEKDIGHAAERGFDQPAIVRLGIAFANYHRSHGNVMADWHAAWRTWTDNEIKFVNSRSPRGQPNGRRTVHDAADDLLAKLSAFDEPAPGGLRGGEGEDVIRLLPPGRRQ